MKKLALQTCFITSTLMILSGCVTEKPHQPISKETKIGVVSLLGNSKFVLAEHSRPNQKIGPDSASQYSHPLTEQPLDETISSQIAQNLKAQGYKNVQAISLPPNTNPVQALKNRPDLSMILVIAPDGGKAPEKNLGEYADETVFGYGVYFNDSSKNPETFAYLNYDISVYNAKNLSLLSNAFYSQQNELSFVHFAPNYQDLPQTTLTEFNQWINTQASPLIEAQALETLNASVG